MKPVRALSVCLSRTGSSLSSQLGCHGKLQAQWEILSRTVRWRVTEENARPLLPVSMCVHMYIQQTSTYSETLSEVGHRVPENHGKSLYSAQAGLNLNHNGDGSLWGHFCQQHADQPNSTCHPFYWVLKNLETLILQSATQWNNSGKV